MFIGILDFYRIFFVRNQMAKKEKRWGFFNTQIGAVVLGTHVGIAQIISSRIAEMVYCKHKALSPKVFPSRFSYQRCHFLLL